MNASPPFSFSGLAIAPMAARHSSAPAAEGAGFRGPLSNAQERFFHNQGQGGVAEFGKRFKKVAENTLETGLRACPAADGNSL